MVTFTNAAASEMRQRILDAIYRKIEEDPDDTHLQKQITLLGKANICTIHSFCLDIIKNNFFEIDISPNFKIGEQAELELLKQDVIEDIMENKYEQEEPIFLKLIDTYTGYQKDDELKELVLKIYNYIQSSPFPEKWLQEQIEELNLDKDFGSTKWGEVILQEVQEEVDSAKLELNNIKKKIEKYPEMEKFLSTITSDIDSINSIIISNWDNAFYKLQDLKWDRWPTDKKVTISVKDEAKEQRNKVKEKIKNITSKILVKDSKEANEDLKEMYSILKGLQELVLEFSKQYNNKKREKNIIDFHDIEHYALKILVDKPENGVEKPSHIAKQYSNKFKEIAIDEYQDSNLVQEYILTMVSNKNNIFMVGDVKQSIYKFRQARPELFLEKYNTYVLKEEPKNKENLKIQLFKNFRSRKNVLDITNTIFTSIMNKELGDIDYNQEEFLNLGADFPKKNEELYKTELNIIETKEEEKEELDEEIQEDEVQRVEKIELEAKLVAKKIKELIEGKYQIWDKDVGYRNITFKDMVILLRATTVQSPVFEKELLELNIPVFSDTSTSYLDTIEIQTILNLLKILDNPLADIPLVSVLKSPIGGFSDNELVQIRINQKHMSFYQSILNYIGIQEDDISIRLRKFIKQLNEWRSKQEYLPLDELIWKIYKDTGYFHYVSLMPNGQLRQANLKLLFEQAKQYETASFKGLYNFIHFMDKLKLNHGEIGSAKIIGENEDVVRIMSIHKSKGLEFPVVFLCNIGKQFNMQDLNQKILLHQDLGLGPNYIDSEMRIEYPTLAKEAIKLKLKRENLAEEMRILYVGLTRAKEKLVLVGTTNDIEKDFFKKTEKLELYSSHTNKINQNVIKPYNSYLDWIELVYLNQKEEIQKILELKTYTKDEILNKTENEPLVKPIELKYMQINNEKFKEIQEKLDWKYPYQNQVSIPTKTSVTKIKEEQNTEELDIQKVQMQIPNFMKDDIPVTPARRGTLTHLCLQELDEKQEYTIEKIQNLIQILLDTNRITQKEAQAIQIQKIVNYTKSKLYKQLQNAKIIKKEQPFYVQLPANEIIDTISTQKVLVQGIIDLYYENNQGELILVDFKTDYVENNDENILIKKYEKQLKLYQYALEESLQRKVNKIIIYSIYLDKEIKI